MFFWIYMSLSVLLIPAVMLFFGRMFAQNAPGKINMTFGYRTARSMKNRDTWEFAHKKIGTLWTKLGAVMLPLSVIAMFPARGRSEDFIGLWSCALLLLQMIPMIGSICFVEKALKETFDEDGNRR